MNETPDMRTGKMCGSDGGGGMICDRVESVRSMANKERNCVCVVCMRVCACRHPELHTVSMSACLSDNGVVTSLLWNI